MPPVAGTGTRSGASPELGRYVLERLRFRKGAELLQRDRRLRATTDGLDLVGIELELPADLPGVWLAAELGTQLPLRADDLVQLLDNVNGHPDRPGLVGERAGDGLADPPRRVRRELESLPMVELLRGAHEPDRPLLDQVEEREALVAVLLRDRDDEPQVRLDHLLLGAVVPTLDPLRELDLLSGRQQVDLAHVLEEELQRVGRDLANLGYRLARPRLHLGPVLDDLDLKLVEGVVEVVDLCGVELELIERERDLGRIQRPGLPRGFQQTLRLVRLQ